MNRPFYESDNDRIAEDTIAGIVAGKWNCSFHKLKLDYIVDRIGLRDRVPIFWAEIKHRNYEFGYYSDFTVSLKKYMTALSYEDDTGLPGLFIIRFHSDIYWHKAKRPVVVGMGGRLDRNDPQDIEPMARVAWSDFKRII